MLNVLLQLSSAPILAEDGVPLQIGSGTVADAEEILNEILGAVDVIPPPGWEQVPISGLSNAPLESIGILSKGFPVLRGTVSVPSSSVRTGTSCRQDGVVDSVDCSAKGASWLDPSRRLSTTPPYFSLEQCARITAEMVDCESILSIASGCNIRFALGNDGNCMPCNPLAPGGSDTSSNTASKVNEVTFTKAFVAFSGDVNVESTPLGVTVSSPGDLRLGHLFDHRFIYQKKERAPKNVIRTLIGPKRDCIREAQAASAEYVMYLPKEASGTCKLMDGRLEDKVPDGAEGFGRSTNPRLQLKLGATMAANLPTPQSELSGHSKFGRFMWRGTVYSTSQVMGLQSITKKTNGAVGSNLVAKSLSPLRENSKPDCG